MGTCRSRKQKKRAVYILKKKWKQFERLKAAAGGDLGELIRDLKTKLVKNNLCK